MIYGKYLVHQVSDLTDLIGIRTLILAQYWQSKATNFAEIEADKPSIPVVPGGVMLMGDQTRRERGVYRTFWTFQGINGDGKSVTFKDRKNSIDYRFDPGFAQVPIQVHKDFQQMLDKYQGYPSNDGTTVIWPPTLGSAQASGLVKGATSEEINPMYGYQEFFEMEGTYTFRYASRELPLDLLDGVGYIAEKLPGNPPPLKDGRNWLKLPPPYQRKGVVHDISEVYWLSRRGGWPRPIYTPRK
jgi:hypothetical protein